MVVYIYSIVVLDAKIFFFFFFFDLLIDGRIDPFQLTIISIIENIVDMDRDKME